MEEGDLSDHSGSWALRGGSLASQVLGTSLHGAGAICMFEKLQLLDETPG